MKVGTANPNGYLTRLATKGLVRELEKVNIARSLALLKQRINSHFGSPGPRSDIQEHFAFGSYTRGTMLPRDMDPHSDIDYLIIFANSDLQPQSCLDRLKRFVDRNYEAEVEQSHPTIILSLNHIRFELVPAIRTGWSGIQIPAKSLSFFRWMPTTPNEFNEELTDKNKSNENLIKPMVRLVKYWNARNNYPFESFELEQWIVEHWKVATDLWGGTLWRRFRDFINDLTVIFAKTEHRKTAVSRAQKTIATVRELELQEKYEEAVRKLQVLLPEV